MQRTPLLVWLGLCLLAGCTRPNDSLPMETTIVTGPRFWTGDPSHAWADGLLVSQGKIVRTVERSEMARLLARGGTVLTLPGVLAVPGLVDAHAHLVGYAMGKREVELTGAATLDETLERIRSFAQQHPEDAWIVGRGWDQTDWPDKAWPNADQLQKIVSDRPAALSRVDGHAMWVNRAALDTAKIDANTPDPPGGKIHRDAQGKPTGILIDNAITLVERQIPAPSDAVVEEALAAAANDLLAVGLVGVHDMGANDQLVNALAHLAKLNRWPLRVTGYASEGSSLHQRLLKDGPFVAGRLSIPGVKLYADGALGSRGARLLAQYADEPSSQGLWITEPPALQAQVEQLVQHGLQPAIHAIGDAANRAVLDAYQAAAQKSPRLASLRPRVEHAQIVDPIDFARFRPLGAIASMQPTHATSDMPWVEQRLGAQRMPGAYAWRSLSSAGAPLAFGSDFPVESIDPRLGLYAAVTRQDASGNPPGGWLPQQRLALEEALAAFTFGAAYATHQEESLGRLVAGQWCDVTVFDRDLFADDPHTILDAKVTATMIGGQKVWPLAPQVGDNHQR